MKNPAILILDKATKDRTTFVIARRLSTVRNASRVLVLDHGPVDGGR